MNIVDKLRNKIGCELYALIMEYGDNVAGHLGDGRYEFFASHDGFDDKYVIEYGFKRAHSGEVIISVRKKYNRHEDVLNTESAEELFDLLGYIPVVKAYCEKTAWERYDSKPSDD